MAGASPSDAGPSRAVSPNPAGRPGSLIPLTGPAGMILPNRAASGNADWSARSRDTSAAWPESIARVSAPSDGCANVATGMACRTPGAWTRASAWATESGWLVCTRTSAPVLNAAWSWSERVQLCRCASASVPVATASTISSAAPPCLIGWRLICQLAMAAVSRLPAAGAARGRYRPPVPARARSRPRDPRRNCRSRPRTPLSSGAAASPRPRPARPGRGRCLPA